MKFGSTLAAATIASVATAELKPKVANFAYAHQWDVVNVEGFNLLFASAYDIGIDTAVTKTDMTTGTSAGNVKLNWFLRAFADWEIQLGMNIGDYMWFIFKSKGVALDIRPVNVSVTMPDWIDQYDYNANHNEAATCWCVDMEANFLQVVSKMNFNFKQIGISFLDVFNGMTATEIAAAEAEMAGENDMAEEEAAEEEEVVEDDGDFFLAKLRQEDDCYEVDENGDMIFDEEGNPIPCENKSSRQEEFAVERGEFQWNWVYKHGYNPDITNLLQYDGFTFAWPLINWCLPPNEGTRYFWMTLLNTFNSGKWGNKEYYSAS